MQPHSRHSLKEWQAANQFSQHKNEGYTRTDLEEREQACAGRARQACAGLNLTDRMSEALSEAVRGLHVADPELGVKPLLGNALNRS